jgi:hypothetical protein
MKWIYKEPLELICPLTTNQINPKTPSLKMYESQRRCQNPKTKYLKIPTSKTNL